LALNYSHSLTLFGKKSRKWKSKDPSTDSTLFKGCKNSLRYQSGNQKPYIEEQTIQWPKGNIMKGQVMINNILQRKLKKAPEG
jgi:hypothetical protein